MHCKRVLMSPRGFAQAKLARILLATLLAAFALTAWPGADEFVATVVYVIDGDSIIVEDDNSNRINVRIVSIDAPEKGRRTIAGQPYAERSRQHLSSLVGRRTVRLISPGRDDYGRVLARVWIDETDIGLAQVCAGYAWVFDAFVSELPAKDQTAYRDCETKARLERRGLWRGSRPVPPWQWRYSHRDADTKR